MSHSLLRRLKDLLQRSTPLGRVWRNTEALYLEVQQLGRQVARLERELHIRCDRFDSVQRRVEDALRASAADQAHRSDRFQQAVEQHLNPWKEREFATLLRFLRRSEYLEAVRTGALPVPELVTEHPLALDTNDSRHPRGARNDNSIVPRFNQRLYDLLGRGRRFSVLDLGCAGGGFVRTLIDDGHVAVGLEGSDFPRLTQRGEWSTVPLHLHTCDVSRPFSICDPGTGETWRFDAITAWELLEHIHERDLKQLLDNIRRHLAPQGYVLCSIAAFEDRDEEHGWVYHNTVQPRAWWLERFASEGLLAVEEHPLGKDDWLRGSGHCFGDWHEDQGQGFHCVLRHAAAARDRLPAPHFSELTAQVPQ
ncbi:MAG: class I SAM-dependent methyltransferase [Planctomycetaceae bacterium]